MLFEAQLNRFPNPHRDFIQGPRLGMASVELWDRSDVVPFFIAFDDDVELALQRKLLASHSNPLHVLPVGPTLHQRSRAFIGSNIGSRGGNQGTLPSVFHFGLSEVLN